MPYAREMMIQKYIGEVDTHWPDGRIRGRFKVYRTGNPKFVLFSCMAGWQANVPGSGWETGLQFPVARARLRRGVLPKGA